MRKFNKNEKMWMLTKLTAEIFSVGTMIAGICITGYTFTDPDMILTGGPVFCLGIAVCVLGIVLTISAFEWKYKDSCFYRKSKEARN